MVDNDEPCAVTAFMTINLPSRSAVALGRYHQDAESATVHPFLPASSNDRIASTHMTSDSPICPTCLLQFNDTTSFKL
ncbi:hypothetical protein TNCV_170891 [Trichonephila clavipes]|nr:hypothetical protein TNCV_170891 [Trichonephila clavipes]